MDTTASQADPDSPAFWETHWKQPFGDVAARFMGLKPADIGELLTGEGLYPTGPGADHGSLENQVFSFPTAQGGVVVKLYRPERWSRPALQDESRLTAALAEAGISVLLPRRLKGGGGLGTFDGMHYMITNQLGADVVDWRQEVAFSAATFEGLGERIAHLHNALSALKAPHRPTLRPGAFAVGNMRALLRTGLLSDAQSERLRGLVKAMVAGAEALYQRLPTHPVHGDLHAFNILWSGDTPTFIDFDDLLRGPAVQDLFLLAAGVGVIPPGETEAPPLEEGFTPFMKRRDQNLARLVTAYRRVRPLDDGQLELIPYLGAARRVWMRAWIAHRQADPCFADDITSFGDASAWDQWLDGLQARLDWKMT